MSDEKLTLTVQINADTGQLEVVGQKMAGLAQQSKGLSSEAASLASAFLPFATGAAIIGFFTESIKAAEDENVALGRLKFQVEALGQSWDKNKQSVTQWGQAIQATTRFSDSEAYEALGRLTRVTGNLTQAQNASQLAMSLSVSSGKSLGETTDFIANLINKNTRALMEGNREFGAFTGGAKDAQGMLDALSKSLGDAAFKEQGLTKEGDILKHQWEDLMKQVGSMFLPAVSGLVKVLQEALTWTQHLGVTFANFVQISIDGLRGIGQAFKAAFTMNWDGVRQAAADTLRQIGYDLRAADEIQNQIADQSIQRAHKSADARVTVTRHETKEEERMRQEQAVKVAEFEGEINRQLAQLNTDQLKKKQQTMQAEITARRQKITNEIKDETQKQKLLAELDDEQDKRTKFYAHEELVANANKSLQIADLAVQTFQVLDSMGKDHTQGELNRARILLALEKAIAIARVWAAAAAAPSPLMAGIAAANTALLVAQFASQSQQLGQAQSQFNQQNTQQPKFSGSVGMGTASDILAGNSGGFGSGASGGGSVRSGGGANIQITIGDIILQGVNDASKIPDNVVEQIASKILDRVKARGDLSFLGVA